MTFQKVRGGGERIGLRIEVHAAVAVTINTEMQTSAAARV